MDNNSNPNQENIQKIVDKLKAYVRILFNTGNTEEKIRKKLNKGNWKKELVNEVIEEVKYEKSFSEKTKEQVIHLEYDIEKAIHKDIEKIFEDEVDDEIRNKIEKQIEEEIFDDLEVAIVKALQKVKPEERVHLLKKTKKENLSIIVSFLILTVVIIIFSLVILAKTNPAFDTSDGKNIYFFNNCRINERFDCSITYYDDYFEMNIINTYPTSSTITYIDVGGCELYPNEHNQKIKLVFEDCIPNNNEITLHYSITASNLEKETKGTIVKRIPITPIIKLIS